MPRLSRAVTLLLLTSTSAFAAPATPEEAARLAALFQSHVGDVPGVFTVKPNGDAYDVTADAMPLVAKIPLRPGEVKPMISITPWQFQIADQGNGKWLVTQNKPFDMSVKAENRLELVIKVGSVNYAAMFDANLRFFTQTKADMADITLTEKLDSPETGKMDVAYALKSMHYESANRETSPGVMDGEGKATFDGLQEIIKSAPSAEGEIPLDLTINAASGWQNVAFTGFRTVAVYDAFGWLMKNIPGDGKELDASKQAELKGLIEAVLPLFQNIKMQGGAETITVGSPYGQFGLAKMDVGVDMNGLVKDGLFRESLSMEKLTMPDGLVPPFATDFVPDRFAVDVKVTGFDVDAPVRLALADMNKLSESGSNPEFDAQIAKAFMPTGAVTVTLNGMDLAGKVYDLSMDGAMTAGPEVKPAGKGAIHAKTLIPLISAMAALPKELGMDMASTVLIAFNAMAKKQTDGSLLWDVEGTEDGKFLINGVDYATLANMGSGIPDQQ